MQVTTTVLFDGGEDVVVPGTLSGGAATAGVSAAVGMGDGVAVSVTGERSGIALFGGAIGGLSSFGVAVSRSMSALTAGWLDVSEAVVIGAGVAVSVGGRTGDGRRGELAGGSAWGKAFPSAWSIPAAGGSDALAAAPVVMGAGDSVLVRIRVGSGIELAELTDGFVVSIERAGDGPSG